MAWFLFCAKLDYFVWFQKYTISDPKHGFSTPKKILTSEPKAFFSFHQTFYPKRINFSSPHDSSLSLKRIPLPTPKVIAFLLTKKNYSFLIQNMFPFLPQTWLLLHPKKNPTPFCKMFSFLHVWKRNSLSPPKYDPISTKIWSFLLTKMIPLLPKNVCFHSHSKNYSFIHWNMVPSLPQIGFFPHPENVSSPSVFKNYSFSPPKHNTFPTPATILPLAPKGFLSLPQNYFFPHVLKNNSFSSTKHYTLCSKHESFFSP